MGIGRDRRNDRKFRPARSTVDERRFPAHSPCPPYRGNRAKPAFIDKNDEGFLFPGFFILHPGIAYPVRYPFFIPLSCLFLRTLATVTELMQEFSNVVTVVVNSNGFPKNISQGCRRPGVTEINICLCAFLYQPGQCSLYCLFRGLVRPAGRFGR